MSSNFLISLPSAPNAAANGAAAGVWDSGLWDVSTWDTGTTLYAYNSGWVSINQTGFSHAPQVQLTMGNTVTPSAKLLLLSVLVETGEVML